jgi:hypothetical protein
MDKNMATNTSESKALTQTYFLPSLYRFAAKCDNCHWHLQGKQKTVNWHQCPRSWTKATSLHWLSCSRIFSLIWRRQFRPMTRAFEQGGIFIVSHLLWHGASVFPVSSVGPPPLIASYDLQRKAEHLYSNQDPHWLEIKKRTKERNIQRNHILKERTYIWVQKFVHFTSFYEFYPI